MKQFLLYSLIVVITTSCKKYLTPDPPSTDLSSQTIFSSDATATAALLAIYARMETDGLAYNQIVMTGLSADELSNYSSASHNIDLFLNNLTVDNSITFAHWRNLYKYINHANALLEGLKDAPGVSTAVNKQLEGEARFLRAFCYFYLVNLFGDVPLVQSTDYRVNATLPRSVASNINHFITVDLEQAISLLSDNYLGGSNGPGTQRVRANKWTAHALLARHYLYLGEWIKAEAHASSVINNTGTYGLLSDLDQVFLKNSREAILQWQNQLTGYNSYPGAFLILTTTPTVVALDTFFVNSFHQTDRRKASWIMSLVSGAQTYYYPSKYKIKQNATAVTEYTMVLRLSEQYLIRSEARTMLDRLTDAEMDLNLIRNRAGLASLNGLSKQYLLDSIQYERHRELFAEFGDRWLNLKRTGMAGPVLSALKGSNWTETDALYPIPEAERRLNSQLSQNQGY